MHEPIPNVVCFELRVRPESASDFWHASLKLLPQQAMSFVIASDSEAIQITDAATLPQKGRAVRRIAP